jgi:hypothetical protein
MIPKLSRLKVRVHTLQVATRLGTAHGGVATYLANQMSRCNRVVHTKKSFVNW